MSLLQMNSALPLAEPLLEQDQEPEAVVDRGEYKRRTKFVLLGAITGFFIQVISLGAYACLLINFNGVSLTESGVLSMDGFFQTSDNNGRVDTASEGQYFGKDALVYTLLSVLTQVDLIVYVLIWVGFTCTMTRNGMKCIRSQFFSAKSSQSADHRRVFVLGVSFLVGIVIGAFGAWSAIDVYLDFPIPLQPILATVVVDLALCYMMVMCFDMGGSGNFEKRATKILDEEDQQQQQQQVAFDDDSDDEE